MGRTRARHPESPPLPPLHSRQRSLPSPCGRKVANRPTTNRADIQELTSLMTTLTTGKAAVSPRVVQPRAPNRQGAVVGTARNEAGLGGARARRKPAAHSTKPVKQTTPSTPIAGHVKEHTPEVGGINATPESTAPPGIAQGDGLNDRKAAMMKASRSLIPKTPVFL